MGRRVGELGPRERRHIFLLIKWVNYYLNFYFCWCCASTATLRPDAIVKPLFYDCSIIFQNIYKFVDLVFLLLQCLLFSSLPFIINVSVLILCNTNCICYKARYLWTFYLFIFIYCCSFTAVPVFPHCSPLPCPLSRSNSQSSSSYPWPGVLYTCFLT